MSYDILCHDFLYNISSKFILIRNICTGKQDKNKKVEFFL